MRIDRSGGTFGSGTVYELEAPHEVSQLPDQLRSLVPESMLTALGGFPSSVESLASTVTTPAFAKWLRSAARSQASILVYDVVPHTGMPSKAFLKFDFGPREGNRWNWAVLADFQTGRPEHCPPSLAEVYTSVGGITIYYGESGSLLSPAEVTPLAQADGYVDTRLVGDPPEEDPYAWWAWFEANGDYLCYRTDGASRWFGIESVDSYEPAPTAQFVEKMFSAFLAKKRFNGGYRS
jgi:hypothetical protein